MEPRPHVLLISQIPMWSMARSVGGPAFEHAVAALAEHYRLTVVTPHIPYVDPGDFPDDVEVRTFEHRLHGAFRSVRKVGWVFDTLAWFTFRWSSWRIVRDICARDRVDLVYGYEIYGVPVARRAADMFGMPLVARYQGTLMSSRMRERLWRLRYYKHVAALSTKADLYVMTNDGTDGRRVLETLGADPARVRFWMNGVDLSIAQSAPTRESARAELGFAPDTTVLLTVSRLSGWKRVDRAMEVARDLGRRGLKIALLVVGVGGDETRLRSLAAQMPEIDIRFVGGVERSRLFHYYRAADALLSLYDYSNLANPVFEAMVLGTPVVALDTGGTSDLVRDRVNGVLVGDAEPAEIAAAAYAVLADPAEFETLRESSAEWARQNLWDWTARMAAETEAIDALLSTQRPATQR